MYTLWDGRSIDPVAMCETLDEALDIVLAGIERNGPTDTDSLPLVHDDLPNVPPVQIARGDGLARLALESARVRRAA